MREMRSRRKRNLVTWLVLLMLSASGCETLRGAERTDWPIAACPAPVTLPHPPISIMVTLEDDSTIVVTALTHDAWAVLVGYVAELRDCAEQRGRTLRAVNATRGRP